MYKKGVLESKPALVKASGIPQLQQQLEQQEESFIKTVKNMQATVAKQLTQIQSI